MNNVFYTIVPLLGFLFEYYMYIASGYASNREWLRVIQGLDDEEAMSVRDQQQFFESNKNKFVGWVLNHINLIGSNGRDQLSYITFVLHYYGLSREGIDILSKYGFGVTCAMFDKFRERHAARGVHTLRYILLLLSIVDIYIVKKQCFKTLPWQKKILIYVYDLFVIIVYTNYYIICCSALQECGWILWIDNYSKFLARSIPTSLKGVFSSCLWTGAAAFHCNNKEVTFDMNVKYNNGDVIPAMPQNILQHSAEVLAGVNNVLRTCRNYYDRSVVKKYDVRNVPPKVDVKRFPHLTEIVNDPNNSTSSVCPIELININIGSNEGLLRIIRNLYDKAGMDSDATCSKYNLMNVDENIYWRIMKVHYFIVLKYFTPGKSLKMFFKLFPGGKNLIYWIWTNHIVIFLFICLFLRVVAV